MQDLLVYSRDFESWSDGTTYAALLAAQLKASLTGVFVYPSPLYAAPSFGSSTLLTAIFDSARTTETRAKAMDEAFVAWARALGVQRPAWRVIEGHLRDVLAHVGTWHDLLVLEAAPDAVWGSPAELASLILATSLPCIVVPAQGLRSMQLDCIVLAWNGTPEAIRAIHAAIPLLQRARRVVLLKGQSRLPALNPTQPVLFEPGRYLEQHGISHEQQDLIGSDEQAGEMLLLAAAGLEADLLVMGAYGRSRFSEWVLGGATRHVLAHAHLPVLMRH